MFATPRAKAIVFLMQTVTMAVAPNALRGQAAPDTSARSATAPARVNVWASAGLGPGEMQANSNGVVAGFLRGSVSVGPWLASYRVTDIGPFLSSGNGLADNALLVGLRSAGPRLFASAELGYAYTSPYYSQSMDAGGRHIPQGSQSAMAFDVALHATAPVGGVALTLSGAAGPARSTYTAMSFSVELGWFGR